MLTEIRNRCYGNEVTSSIALSASGALATASQSRRQERAREELASMSEAMIAEHGLVNQAQAALLLGVSGKRICELVKLGKLKRFDFLGRTYVSVREVRERYQRELKAGRPRRGVAARALASVKAALKTDAAQAKLGGYAGPYEKRKRRQKRE